MHHGQRDLRRTRSESRPPGRNLRRSRSRGGCHDYKQGLRLRTEGGRARGASDPNRQQFHRGRRRHGIHDQRALPAAAGAQRISPRQRAGRRFHGQRRPLGHLQQLPHGHHRRERSREIRHHARRTGPVRRELASQSGLRNQRVPLQIADRSRGTAGEEKRRSPGDLRQRRIPARRHHHRNPARPEARLQERRHRHRRQRSRRERWRRRRRRHQRQRAPKNWARSPWFASWPKPPAASNPNG